MDRKIDWNIITELWKSVKQNVTTTPTVLTPAQIVRIQSALQSIQPTMNFLKNPVNEELIGFIPYAFATILVLGLSSIVFNATWKSGSLNRFTEDQYNKLLDWSRQKYITISREKLARERKRKVKKVVASEVATKKLDKSQSVFGKLSSFLPTGIISKVLDPTDVTSWGVLGGMWAAYMGGFQFTPPSFLSALGLQIKLNFEGLVILTAAKLITFTHYAIKKFIRNEIYGEEYDSLFVRLPSALMTSFINLLHRRLAGLKVEDSDVAEIKELQQEIKNLTEASKMVEDQTVKLTSEQIEQIKQNPNLFETVVKRSHNDLLFQRSTSQSYLEKLVEFENYKSEYGIKWRRVQLENVSGILTISGFFKDTKKSMESNILKLLLYAGQEILICYGFQNAVPTELETFGKNVTESTKHTYRYIRGHSDWHNFLDKKAELLPSWEKQRDTMITLRKLLTVYLLDFYKDIKPIDVNQLNWKDFTDEFDFSSEIEKLKQVLKTKDLHTYQQVNEEVKIFIDLLETSATSKKDTFLSLYDSVLRRNTEVILCCKSLCTLIDYLVACKDAFDISIEEFEKNILVSIPDSPYWPHTSNSLDLISLYESLKSYKVRTKFISYDSAMKFYYYITQADYFSKLLSHVLLHACHIYSIYSSNEELSTRYSDHLEDFKLLYGIITPCKEEKEECKECNCKPVPEEEAKALSIDSIQLQKELNNETIKRTMKHGKFIK